MRLAAWLRLPRREEAWHNTTEPLGLYTTSVLSRLHRGFRGRTAAHRRLISLPGWPPPDYLVVLSGHKVHIGLPVLLMVAHTQHWDRRAKIHIPDVFRVLA